MVIMRVVTPLEGTGYELRSVPDIPYGLVYTKNPGMQASMPGAWPIKTEYLFGRLALNSWV